MQLRSLLLLLTLLCPFWSQAQGAYTIGGKITDTASMMNMGYTSISVINQSDSLLQDFTRADEEGVFRLTVPQKGNYLLIYAHPTFANFIGEVKVDELKTDVGEVPMISKQNLLQEVIVTDARAIIIKGDTVEYAADSFKVRQFATVEELLKKLPGIEVDQKGNITAHGEKVQKMLVDGDEFFADDPAVLSKMLRAAAVDKVQVFDKKTEEAQLTGIDDGTKIKTINLTLKENAKSGYFGKIILGGGLPKYYENQLMVSAFKNKRKIAAYAITSNTNNVGLGWNDASKYGGGGAMMSMGDGDGEEGMMMMSSGGGGNELGGYNGTFSGEGLPRSINGGVHYSNKFGAKDQVNLSTDYRVNSYQLEVSKNTRTQYIMPDTQYVNNTTAYSKSSNLLNSLNGRTDITIDSLSNLVVTAKGSINQAQTNSLNTANYTDMDGNLINDSRTENNNTSTTANASLDVSYRKKYKVQGRSFSATLNGSYMQRNADGSFLSENNFYTTGTAQSFNQRKTDSTLNVQTNLRLTYTEPLIKDKMYLVLNAYSNYIKNTASNLSFDRAPGGETDTLNAIYSSDYDYSIWTNSAGANLRYNINKQLKFNFGGNVAYAQYQNTNNFSGAEFSRNYLNFFPRASLSFSRNRSMNVGFNYNGSTSQPRIDQIQVMVQNTDPLNIRLGNPDLVQAFNHSFSLNFNQYKMLSETYFYGNVRYSFTQNAFSQRRDITPEGVNTYQTINLNGNWNTGVYGGYSTKIKPIKTRLGIGLNGNYNNSNSYLNSVLNTSRNTSVGLRLDLDYYKDSVIELSYNISPTYNISSSSVNALAVNKFLMTRQEFEAVYTFWKGIDLGFSFNWLLREKTDAQDKNNNIFLANAFLSKSILKNRSLNIRLEGNDLFNRNVGFSRSAYDNYITESTYNNIRRYFLLKLAWNFTYSKAASGKAPGNTETEESND